MIGNLARRSEQTENKAMEQTDAVAGALPEAWPLRIIWIAS